MNSSSSALGSILGKGNGPAAGVASRTAHLLAGPEPDAAVNSVIGLARALPALDDVRKVVEGDDSELSLTEVEQRARTEEVIATALAAGDASLWVIAQAVERAARGRWWRKTHPTLEAYVQDKVGRSASYARRLRAGAPLALETAERTGVIPNPGQIRDMRRTEQQHGTDAAVTLFDVLVQVTADLGSAPTAISIKAVHEALPPVLPELPEQQRSVIEETTREVLGASEIEQESNGSVPIGTPSEDESEEVIDAEVVGDPLADLEDALRRLRAVNRDVTREALAAGREAADPERYRRISQALLSTATSLRNRVSKG
ncbi:hypothetical protein ACFYYS_38620 [Streptomyces sp. NPDC002120]|uniref:hypothetical protein n=1 Tax=Streptomyces sp. NPDC002120 TaxID=3364631 RepID=UPI0036D18AD6